MQDGFLVFHLKSSVYAYSCEFNSVNGGFVVIVHSHYRLRRTKRSFVGSIGSLRSFQRFHSRLASVSYALLRLAVYLIDFDHN